MNILYVPNRCFGAFQNISSPLSQLLRNRQLRTQHPDSDCCIGENSQYIYFKSSEYVLAKTLRNTHLFLGSKKKKFLTWSAYNKHKEGKQPGTHRILLLLWSLGQRHKHTRYMSNTSPETRQMPKWNYSSCGLFFPHSQRCSGFCDSCFSASSLSLRRQPLSCFSQGGETARLLIEMSTTTTLRSHCTSPGV